MIESGVDHGLQPTDRITDVAPADRRHESGHRVPLRLDGEGITQLDLARGRRRKRLEHIEDARMQRIPADDHEITRRVGHRRFFHHSIESNDLTRTTERTRFGWVHHAVPKHVTRGHSLQCHRRAFGREIGERDEQRRILHDLVGQHHEECFVTHRPTSTRHGVSEATWFVLMHERDLDVGAVPTQAVGQRRSTLSNQGLLHVGSSCEITLDRRLGATRDDHDAIDTGPDGLVDDELQCWLLEDRQELLGHGLGGRQHAGSLSGGGYHRRADP